MLHSNHMRNLLVLMVLSVAAGGCYATTTTGYTPAYVGPAVSVSATTVAPDLVYVSPGVQVIADYDEPIFYSDGFYWREYGGTWYHSRYYDRGWAYAAPPRAIVSIGNRRSYVHYRPRGYTPRGSYVRDHRGYNRPVVRDNRSYGRSRPVVRDNRGYDRSRPIVRDNRNYNRSRPVVRDNRGYNRSRPVVRDNRNYNRSRPVVRDNRRSNRRDHRR